MIFPSRLSRVLPLTTLLIFAATTVALAQTPASFGAGDLVVYRVGTGAAALSSAATAVFLDEYSATGTLVQSIALPTTTSGSNLALTASGNASSEGELNLSADGHYLALTGYAAAPGVASIVGTTATANPRVVGIVSGDGSVDTSTSFNNAFSANNIRGAYTDGNSVYAVGANTGVVYAAKGATTGTVISTATTNLRDILVSNGQLYVSSSSGSTRIATAGTGTPTTSPQTITNLPGLSSSSPAAPYAFFFATLGTTTNDTLYVADGNLIDKFSLSGGTYALTGTITGVTGVEGLTGSVTSGTVNLYASTPTGIYSATDASGYNMAASGAASKIASAATNEAFRGLAFAPQLFGGGGTAMPEPGVFSLLTEAGVLLAAFGLARRRRIV